MESSSTANPVASSSNRARESRRRKKRMKTQHSQNCNDVVSGNNKISWKSETTQQLYSSNLLQALRKVRLSPSSSSSSPAPRRGRAVREAADRVLAVAARGRTRWSRAILTNRLRLKFLKKATKRQRAAAVTGNSRSARKPRLEILRLKGKNLPAVQRKVKTLGRLVPGCRKEPLPVILEEAADYVSALEMQIRTMRELLSRLSPGEGSTSGPSPPENSSV